MKTNRKSAAVKSAAVRSASRKPSTKSTTIRKVRGAALDPTKPATSTVIRHGITDEQPRGAFVVVIVNSETQTEKLVHIAFEKESCDNWANNFNSPRVKPFHAHAEVRRIDPTSVVDEHDRPIFKDAKPIDDKAARLRAAATAEPFATVARQFRDWLAAMSAKSTGGTLPAKALAAAFDQALFGVFCALDDAMMEAGGTKGYAACNCATNYGEAR